MARPISPHVPEKVVKITAALLFDVHGCPAVFAKTFLKIREQLSDFSSKNSEILEKSREVVSCQMWAPCLVKSGRGSQGPILDELQLYGFHMFSFFPTGFSE